MNKYHIIYKIYRQLLIKRKHFIKQYKVLEFLFQEYNIEKEARMLDGATGTGDIISMLYSNGYTNVFGIDGSHHILSLTPENIKNRVVNIEWRNINTFFNSKGHFDFIFFLGHSLPHISIRELSNVIQSVYEGLNIGGVLAFDIRPWVRMQDNALRQFGREEEVTRYLGDFELDLNCYRLFEEVSYKDTIQELKYCLMPKDTDKEIMSETLNYHIFHWKDAQTLLRERGFDSYYQKIYELPEWPYLILTARKT